MDFKDTPSNKNWKGRSLPQKC